ncbi:hypothetical protein OsJ_27453 [Oryza sativa Japonica Group]|uniref:Uncharacterized protein n=1 Tax=Oryza sativa subsp. japonica TaxID=39947 RepID=A3BTH1_ORYSJ|nr:hypothetical protein OsJ_27453 [Oryza sativa Japonica Group]
MGRPPCCVKAEVKKGPWTPEEDLMLVAYVQEHGPGNWRAVPTNTGLMRCSKSCRLRWTNYLRPGIKRGNFTDQEEKLIVHLQALLGNRSSAASVLSGEASHSGGATAPTPDGSTVTSKTKDEETAGAPPPPPPPAFSMLESWLLDDGMGHGEVGLMDVVVPLGDPSEFF